ncbi:hypothetical protein IMCC26207_107158 [Actinobacteria bacterium IMCC26207]|nr:hypothetical protein IMCC26207_107158 [Actinobacteria bacterium IMCC26207]
MHDATDGLNVPERGCQQAERARVLGYWVAHGSNTDRSATQ